MKERKCDVVETFWSDFCRGVDSNGNRFGTTQDRGGDRPLKRLQLKAPNF
jgi:hypothetical protein